MATRTYGEACVNIPSLYEIASTDRVLNGLGLALAEAKMQRSLIRSRIKPFTPQANLTHVERIKTLDREILWLEDQLSTLRSSSANDADGAGTA